MEKFISTKQAAAILGVSRRHVRWLIAQGDLPDYRVGREFLLREIDVTSLVRRPKGNPNFLGKNRKKSGKRA